MRRCRSRCAKCRSTRATTRATSRWSPPAARDRCTSAPSRASCYIPTVIVPLFPVAFLGARHAARRRASRFHPHGLFRSRQRRLRRSSSPCTTRWSTDARAACVTPRTRNGRSISTCATSARSSRCRCRSTLRSAQARRPQGIRTAFDALYEHRYAHHSPDEPVEMVNIRLGAIGKRPKLNFPSSARRRGRSPPSQQRDVYFTIGASRCAARSTSATSLWRGRRSRRAGADPGARHDDGAVRERRLQGRGSGELIIDVGGA